MKRLIYWGLGIAATGLSARNPFVYVQEEKQQVVQQKKQRVVLAEACIAGGATCLFCSGMSDGAFDDAENVRIVPRS